MSLGIHFVNSFVNYVASKQVFICFEFIKRKVNGKYKMEMAQEDALFCFR